MATFFSYVDIVEKQNIKGKSGVKSGKVGRTCFPSILKGDESLQLSIKIITKEKYKKVRWEDIYKDFRSKHPRLAKSVIHWQPYAYATVVITFKGGSKGLYNHDEQKMVWLNFNKDNGPY